ncbi:MAG TPA: extracellular solute-binding protein [Acidimicrobiales bacterium]|nr:extracellular solute-binding protein [Acidimicrobiales bacterium]
MVALSSLAIAAAGVTVAGAPGASGAPAANRVAGAGVARAGRATTATAAGRATGTASVAYAGSLAYLDEKVVGPAFSSATGYAYQGRGAGSDALSQEISSGEITPNVFESVGAAPITALEPKFTRWYVQFAASPLVVAYNPSGPYGHELAAIASGRRPVRDLFALMARPGFALGRTDPNLDPQGAAFVEMVELAQRTFHLPAGTAHAILGRGALGGSSSPEIFDETALEPRLQAGQLDAASAYLSQAVQLHLHYISLPASIDFGNPADAASYAKASVRLRSGTVKTGKPLVVDITTIGTTDAAAADAFVAYVLSAKGRAEYRAGGYALLAPSVHGTRADVPASVLGELSS